MAFDREINIDANVGIHIMYIYFLALPTMRVSRPSFVGLSLLLKRFRERLRNWSRLKETKRTRELYATLDPVLDSLL